ncbi:MAG: 50S ribosomal protein L32 [Anaerolineae bacterium]|nr:50S ribosomal protein L32 [Anaerolineae bacterium]
MGALPKRKVSRIRRDRRRAHYLRLNMPTMVPCPQCHTLHLSHHVCLKCGTYNGVQVIAQEEAAPAK